MKTVAIIQARMGSSRLPGKVLRDLHGRTMLSWVVDRVRRARTIDCVVIATTTQEPDATLEDFCRHQGWLCYRGSENDVLDRYYQAASWQQASTVVRITSDCPLIDPLVIDQVVNAFHHRQPQVDYAANILPYRTFPRGLDTEVFSFHALQRAWNEAHDVSSREHVTAFLYRQPGRFRTHGVVNSRDWSHLRWTVDTPDDYELVRAILDHFADDRFSWQDVIAAYDQHPEWYEMNAHIQQKAA